MLDKAISKIKTEMDQNKNNGYIQIVGGFLLQELNANPGAAEKVLVEGKTVAKSLDEMKEEAKKKKVGNCAVLTDQEGFAIVLKYFGIDGQAAITTEVPLPVVEQKPTAAPVKKPVDFDVNLEDLL